MSAGCHPTMPKPSAGRETEQGGNQFLRLAGWRVEIFVKGDAVAGLLITLLNIIMGLK